MDAIIDFILNFSGITPYLIVFGILLLCGFGLPIPEDVTLFVGGVLSYYGVTDVYIMIGVSMFGVMLGDTIIFLLGAKYGRALTRRWLFARLFPPERLAVVQKKLHERGNKLVFAARFMPGLRAPIFFSAGTLHLPFRVFFFYDGLAALISVPAIVGAVYYFGDELDRVIRVIQRVEHSIILVIVAAILLVAAKWYLTHRKLKKS